jgi:hypothetical protein
MPEGGHRANHNAIFNFLGGQFQRARGIANALGRSTGFERCSVWRDQL